jgi:hypothetical protein
MTQRNEMRIFISSTFEDLNEYRQEAFKAIQGLGLHADDMILWSANELDATTNSVQRVAECDVLILILAHRYGYVPPGTSQSITQTEYEAARAAGVPVLAFFLDEATPWPPAQVEWSKQRELRRFKESVEVEVTRKVFRTPQELAIQVTTALALLVERKRRHLQPAAQPTTRALVRTRTRLRHDPDTIVQIGNAEDGLPLLLNIVRGCDLTPWFRSLSDLISPPGHPIPDAMLHTLRQSIEQYANTTWAASRIVEIKSPDDVGMQYYVTQNTMSQLFKSVLSRLLLSEPLGHPQDWRSEHRAESSIPSVPLRIDRYDAPMPWDRNKEGTTVSIPIASLQSVGGANRFLGIAIDGDALITAGTTDGQWAEWREYMPETLTASFPNCRFSISTDHDRLDDLRAVEFEKTLLSVLASSSAPAQHAELGVQTEVRIQRQELGMILVKVVRRLHELHSHGQLHGDLKPHNILLARDGPVLIDRFDVSISSRSPGWTPKWSAPEQMLGLPMSESSDLYPIGVMMAYLVGAELVGEVRRLKITPTSTGRTEFDVFYNPQIAQRDPFALSDGASFKAWSRIIRRCLLFDPEYRVGSASLLAEHLEALLNDHPIAGTVTLRPLGRLVAATLIDGTLAVARMLDDTREGSLGTLD